MCLQEKGTYFISLMIFVILHSQQGFELFQAACLERNLLHFEDSAESFAGRMFG